MSRALGTMRDYEFRLGDAVQAEMHLSYQAAIRAAQKFAKGESFEVWRGAEQVWPRRKSQ